MNMVIGSDHRGFEHKEYIKRHVAYGDSEWRDVGAFDSERSDYPLFAELACAMMRQGKVEKGVLICGSGGGMAVAANRFNSIYAAVAWNVEVAAACASDDKINILVIPSDFVTAEESVKIIQTWLRTPFKGGRYQERIAMIDALKGL